MDIKRFIPALIFVPLMLTACGDDGETTDGGNGNAGTNPDNINMNIATAETPELSRLEFPKVRGGRSKILTYYSGSAYGLNYSVEWDAEKKSQRWSCYVMVDHRHAGNDTCHTYRGDAGRYDPKKNPGNHPGGIQYPWDPDLPKADRWLSDLFYGSDYDHGHICPSADRQYSKEANYQTFYMTNMQPQYNNFNAGLWQDMEQRVRDITPTAIGDTLFVCKGGTIDNESQIKTRIKNQMIVPKFFYTAMLMKKGGKYSAMAFWVEHTNKKLTGDDLQKYAVSIDELESLTGIDFFCNLPDNIEKAVESSFDYNEWTTKTPKAALK